MKILANPHINHYPFDPIYRRKSSEPRISISSLPVWRRWRRRRLCRRIFLPETPSTKLRKNRKPIHWLGSRVYPVALWASSGGGELATGRLGRAASSLLAVRSGTPQPRLICSLGSASSCLAISGTIISSQFIHWFCQFFNCVEYDGCHNWNFQFVQTYITIMGRKEEIRKLLLCNFGLELFDTLAEVSRHRLEFWVRCCTNHFLSSG